MFKYTEKLCLYPEIFEELQKILYKYKYDVKRVLKLQVNILIDFDPSKTEIIYNCKPLTRIILPSARYIYVSD